MSSANAASARIDEARQVIGREFARMLNGGRFHVRVRVLRKDGASTAAWFYSHHDEGWHKEPEEITDRELLAAIEETLEMLVSREHADAWSTHRHTTADFQDTDVRFHGEKLVDRMGDKLESVLTGILFHDSHDSSKDKRRNIRTPHRGA